MLWNRDLLPFYKIRNGASLDTKRGGFIKKDMIHEVARNEINVLGYPFMCMVQPSENALVLFFAECEVIDECSLRQDPSICNSSKFLLPER